MMTVVATAVISIVAAQPMTRKKQSRTSWQRTVQEKHKAPDGLRPRSRRRAACNRCLRRLLRPLRSQSYKPPKGNTRIIGYFAGQSKCDKPKTLRIAFWIALKSCGETACDEKVLLPVTGSRGPRTRSSRHNATVAITSHLAQCLLPRRDGGKEASRIS